MLKIRLRRVGAIRQPHYRIVVADARSPRDGRFIESLGHYNPLTDPATIQIDVVKYEDWKKKGAQPTSAVASLVRQFNRAARAAEAAGIEQPVPGRAGSGRQTRTASGKGVTKPPTEVTAEAAVAEPVGENELGAAQEAVEATPGEDEGAEAEAAVASTAEAAPETADEAAVEASEGSAAPEGSEGSDEGAASEAAES
jgi:small subunit ribosomal protein S16